MPSAMVKLLNHRGGLAVLMLLMLALGAWFGWSYIGPGPAVGWKTAQFFFSYQDLGFVSRGLVATLLHPFPALLSAPGILTVTAAMLLGFVAVCWRLVDVQTRWLAPADRAVLAAVCICAPSMFLRMGFDYGRFDPLNVILMIAALHCLRNSRDLAAALVAAVALLIHEGFLVLEFPVLCAWVLAEGAGDWRARAVRLGRFAALPGLTYLALVAWGQYEPGLDALAAKFAANPLFRAAATRGEVNRDALLVLTRSLRETFFYTQAFFAERRPFGHLAFIGAWLFVMARSYDGFFARHALRRDWLYFAAYSPLLMSVIACDYFRWVALASVNMLVVVLLKLDVVRRRGEVASVPCDLWAKLAIASCLLGPISNTKSFPFFFTVLEKISPWPLSW